jgi:hypothetical protein
MSFQLFPGLPQTSRVTRLKKRKKTFAFHFECKSIKTAQLLWTKVDKTQKNKKITHKAKRPFAY